VGSTGVMGCWFGGRVLDLIVGEKTPLLCCGALHSGVQLS